MSFFDKLARGLEAATKAMGADELARTNAFELARSGYFPTAICKRMRDDGVIVVEMRIADAMSVMTAEEFDRFARELDQFREIVSAAVEASRRVGT